MANEPLIKLEPGGKAPILSYNVPEPTSYTGRNFIELDYPGEFFTAKASAVPPADEHPPVGTFDRATVRSTVVAGMKLGFSDGRIFSNTRLAPGSVRLVETSASAASIAATVPITPRLATLDVDAVAAMVETGKRLNVYRSMYGTLTYNYVPTPTTPRPRLYLIETYRLSSFLGSYGAGRILKTFTLLPGEKTKISVKTFLKTEQERKQSSSILDSVTQESADDFENTLQNEQSDQKSYAETFEYHAEAEADASWGWGSAKVSGGVKGGTSSAREEFAKNVSTSTQKHSAKASAKRDVQVNTSFEVKETEQEETSIERTLENVNMSRTLNFVFRQMNQEFISILHLVDVRVGFFNGFAQSKMEAPIARIDSLLEDFIVTERRGEVRAAILAATEAVLDYRDEPHPMIETMTLPGSAESFLRTRKGLVSVFEDTLTGFTVPVPGVILSVSRNVMRTDGVIVEALLGEGEALDGYARRLQEIEVARRESLAAKEAAEAARVSLINDLAEAGDLDRARALAIATCCEARTTCPCDAKRPAADGALPDGEGA